MPEFLRLALPIGFLSLMLPGCDQVENALKPERVPNGPEEAEKAEEAEDPHGSRPTNASPAVLKLRTYDQAISWISPSIVASRDHYFRKIANRTSGPTMAEAGRMKIDSIRGSAPDRAALKSALTSKPAMTAIDEAAKNYEHRVAQLRALVEKARIYYLRPGPKPKGLTMHRPLAKAYGAAIAADEQFRKRLEPALDEAEIKEIKQLEVDPKRKLLWKWRVMYRESKLLMKLFADHQGQPAHADAETALDRFTHSFNSFPELRPYFDIMSASQCLAAAKEHVQELKTKRHRRYPPHAANKGWKMYEACHALRAHNVSWGLLQRKLRKER